MKAYKLIPWALLLAAAVGGVQSVSGPPGVFGVHGGPSIEHQPSKVDGGPSINTDGGPLAPDADGDAFAYIPANRTGAGLLECYLWSDEMKLPQSNVAFKRLTLSAPVVVFAGKPASYKPKPAEVLAWVNTHFGLDPSILRVAQEFLPADWTERVKPKGGKARRLRHVRLEQGQSWGTHWGLVDSTFVLVHLDGNMAYAVTGGYLPLDQLPKTSSATANSFISPSAALAATAAAVLKLAPDARADVASALRAAAANPAGASPASVAATLAAAAGKADVPAAAASSNFSIVSEPKQVAACWEGAGCGPAYKTIVFLPPGESFTPQELHVYVDANTGDKLSARNMLRTLKGVGKGLYNTDVKLEVTKSSVNLGRALGGRYELYNSKTKSSTLDYLNFPGPGQFANAFPVLVRDEDNVWGSGQLVDTSVGSDRQTAAVDAHFGVSTTLEYYKKVHGRKGLDGRGSLLQANVHVGFFYNNAFFYDGKLFFGDGSRPGTLWETSCRGDPPLTTLDITAHEIAHGVTDTSAKLVYELESGALNEAVSDIMAQCVVQWAYDQKLTANHGADFMIGADMWPNKNCSRSFIRSMKDPQVDRASSFACYDKIIGQRLRNVPFPADVFPPEQKQYWHDKNACEAEVHLSSGVYNRFFWLAAAGFSKCPKAGKPASIGVPSACGIVYRAVTQYMTPSSDFFDVRAATGQAAIDLFGAASPELSAVQAAWDVVGAPTSADGSGPACDVTYATKPDTC